MGPQEIVLFAVKASIILMVFGIALSARLADAVYLLQRPKELLRSVLAMSVIMPLVAATLCALFNLHPAVKIALVAMAVSPVPPFLPKKQLKSGGNEPYVIGLLTATSLLAIITVPVTIALLGTAFDQEVRMTPALTFKIVLTTVLAPLALGILIRTTLPRVADKIEPAVSLIAVILLVAGFLPILIKSGPEMFSLIGNGTLLAIAAFVIIGLAVGHALGGPHPNDRTALALATSARHPAVAIAAAHLNYPGQHDAMSAVLLMLLLSTLLAIPYLQWRKKHNLNIAPNGA